MNNSKQRQLSFTLLRLAILAILYLAGKRYARYVMRVAKEDKLATMLLKEHHEMVRQGRDDFFQDVMFEIPIGGKIVGWDPITDNILNVNYLIGLTRSDYLWMGTRGRNKELVQYVVKRTFVFPIKDSDNGVVSATIYYRFIYRKSDAERREIFDELATEFNQQYAINNRPGTKPRYYPEMVSV